VEVELSSHKELRKDRSLNAVFDMPTAGEIFIGDRLVSSAEKKVFVQPEDRNVGMVFQNYAVWPHMDVFKNVAYPLKISKVKSADIRDRVMRVLSLVKLKGMESRYPHQLSGGQQQRVALARALIMEPDVMLLDEPLSNLDAKLREEMRFEIKDIQRRIGVTIIYVTHDQAEAMAMSDRILLLHEATVQQLGTPRELYERPENQFAADFIGLINFMRIELISKGDGLCAKFLDADDDTPFDINYSPEQLSPGMQRVFAVRPENVKLVSPQEGHVTGKVRKKVYLGNILDYRIVLGKEEIRVEAPSTAKYDIDQVVGLKFTDYVIFE